MNFKKNIYSCLSAFCCWRLIPVGRLLYHKEIKCGYDKSGGGFLLDHKVEEWGGTVFSERKQSGHRIP